MTVAQSTLVTLPVSNASRTNGSRPAVYRNALRFALPILILVVWQMISTFGIVSPRLLPTPTTIVEGFVELWNGGDIQAAIPASLSRAISGLAIGASIGLVFGVFNGLSKVSEELFDSTLQMVRLVPFIAVVPLFILWFGIGDLPKILLITLAALFPIYLNTYSGVRNVDHKLIEAGLVFGLSRLQLVLQVILPQAAASVLVGLRFAMSSSLLALIVAEQVNSSSGIGYIIFLAQGAMRIDLIIVAIIIYAILGICIDVLMRGIERIAMPWR